MYVCICRQNSPLNTLVYGSLTLVQGRIGHKPVQHSAVCVRVVICSNYCEIPPPPPITTTRVHLDHLHSPEAAVRIVKESQSIEGAKMVAK